MKELSSSKKIGKARFALVKTKPYMVAMIFLILFILLLSVAVIIQMFEDDYSDTAIIGTSVLSSFLTYSFLAVTTVVPRSLSVRQSALIKGNANMYDLFIQFPITKKQLLTKVLKNWALISSIPIVTVLAMCIIPMFYKRAQEINSQIGLIVILTVIILSSIEVIILLLVNCKIHKSTSFKVTYIFVSYAIFMFVMTCSDKAWFLKSISGFDIFSGIVGVIILLAVIPVMWIITKKFLIDKKGKEAWHYEIIE